MAEQADDLGIPMKLRPQGTKVPSYPAGPPRPAADAARAPGSPQQSTEGSAESRSNEVDRRTLIIGQGISERSPPATASLSRVLSKQNWKSVSR